MQERLLAAVLGVALVAALGVAMIGQRPEAASKASYAAEPADMGCETGDTCGAEASTCGSEASTTCDASGDMAAEVGGCPFSGEATEAACPQGAENCDPAVCDQEGCPKKDAAEQPADQPAEVEQPADSDI